MRSAVLTIALLGSAAVWNVPEARAQYLLLDNFEAAEIRVANPTNGTGPSDTLLWNQYEGDFTEGPDPGSEAISTANLHDGTRALGITVTGGNLYAQLYTNNGSIWRYMREFTQPSAGWKYDTFNRMRFWIFVPTQIQAAPPGQQNLQFGTYVRRTTSDPTSAESDNGHFYHQFNIPYTGAWHQVIVDTHPHHQRGNNGGTEAGDKLYPTSETGKNYFDLMTRMYLDFTGPLASTPATFYLDGFELYRESRTENITQVYALNGVYAPATNKIYVSWSRNKNENAINHEVRYSFSDIFRVGWASATPAPSGTIVPPGWQGYNGMEWSTTSINVTGQKIIYVAIKPQNSSLFRQIAIPLSSSGGTPPAVPTGLTILP